MQVRLIDTDGSYTYHRTHRLVALAFLGPPPSDRPECNHKNGDKTDNRVSNLEYASRQENALHSTRTLGKNRGEGHGMAKLTDAKVRRMRAAHKRGVHYSVLMERFGVNRHTVWSITSGRSWKHVT